jgi:hypothetical protein
VSLNFSLSDLMEKEKALPSLRPSVVMSLRREVRNTQLFSQCDQFLQLFLQAQTFLGFYATLPQCEH